MAVREIFRRRAFILSVYETNDFEGNTKRYDHDTQQRHRLPKCTNKSTRKRNSGGCFSTTQYNLFHIGKPQSPKFISQNSIITLSSPLFLGFCFNHTPFPQIRLNNQVLLPLHMNHNRQTLQRPIPAILVPTPLA